MPGFLPTSEAGKPDEKSSAMGAGKSVSGQGMGRARATMGDTNYSLGPVGGKVAMPNAEASQSKSSVNAEASLAKVKHISKRLCINTVLCSWK